MCRALKIALVFSVLLPSCDFTSPGTYTEFSRTYCPDSSKYLLKYASVQGAWDGGRTTFTALVDAKDTTQKKQLRLSSHEIDGIYWQGNDTIIVEEKFTDYISRGSTLKDTLIDDIVISVIQKDPIDSTFTRKIIYREVSPDQLYDLIVYRYVKPVNGYYFLNISVINNGDSIPKFGNFYVSLYDFDCFTDIRWDKAGILSVKASKSCYYAFNDYLVKSRPDIKFTVQASDDAGNISSR